MLFGCPAAATTGLGPTFVTVAYFCRECHCGDQSEAVTATLRLNHAPTLKAPLDELTSGCQCTVKDRSQRQLPMNSPPSRADFQ
ncbi:hypothetical protein VTN02DRAFT_151 [Thermoascus thermophilus]